MKHNILNNDDKIDAALLDKAIAITSIVNPDLYDNYYIIMSRETLRDLFICNHITTSLEIDGIHCYKYKGDSIAICNHLKYGEVEIR